MTVVLRMLRDADLDQLFEWERNPDAVAMAAFTRADPTDRAGFDAHYQRVRSDPANLLRAIDDGAGLAGTIGSFTMEGEREVTYWSGPRSLPLWLPEDSRGMTSHDVSAAVAAGLTTRPIGETAVDTLAWLRSEPNPGRTGLTRAEEQDLLDDWHLDDGHTELG